MYCFGYITVTVTVTVSVTVMSGKSVEFPWDCPQEFPQDIPQDKEKAPQTKAFTKAVGLLLIYNRLPSFVARREADEIGLEVIR